MPITLSVASSAVQIPVAPALLKRWIKRAIAQAEFSDTALVLHLEFLSAPKQRAINRDFRGKDYATNVLTFPSRLPGDDSIHADVLICPSVVRKEAKEQGKAFEDHLAHLVVHGTLHALGFDHEKPRKAKQMEALEIGTLASLGIADPYL